MKCRNVRGLIAASLYDDLTKTERNALDGHLLSCAACRAERDKLKKLADLMTDTAPPLDFDLLPAIRQRMTQPHPYSLKPKVYSLTSWRPAFAAAAICLIIAALIYNISGPTSNQPPAYNLQPTAYSLKPKALSPVQQALNQASTLADNRDFTGACQVLKQVLEDHPADPVAALAQLKYADIVFSELHWYPEAYKAYNTLWRNYYSLFSASPESIDRFNLLADFHAEDYNPIKALDVARNSTEDKFAQLENVVARYPATSVAHLAANDMAKLMAEEAQISADTQVLSMEHAKDRCTNPLAVAQLKLELGKIYWKELNNPGKARDFFHEVEQSNNEMLAQLAKEALTGIN